MPAVLDQLTELEARWGDISALGIDQLATVTTDPLPALDQKVAIEGITTPVIADPQPTVSEAYSTLAYGMMGGSHNGHTFIGGAPDGTIEWRGLRRRTGLHDVPPGRRAPAGPARGIRRGSGRVIEATLLTQHACAFCDDAKAVLRRLAAEYPLRVRELDLASDEGRALGEQAGVLFPPGILFDGEPVAYGRPSQRRLRRELRRRLEGPRR